MIKNLTAIKTLYLSAIKTVHALIWTCAGGNVFFYYTKGHAVSFTAIFTHAVGNWKQAYFSGWP